MTGASYQPEVTIGLLGTPVGVARMQSIGDGMVADGYSGVRFLASAYTDPAEGAERLTRLAEKIDVALFIGPLFHDACLEALSGDASVPTTYVPLSAGALYATLLRATLEGVDVARVSIDSHARKNVAEAYADARLPLDDVHVCEYTGPECLGDFPTFHLELLRSGAVGAAFTTVTKVEAAIRAEGFEVRRIEPTPSTVRRSIETASWMARGARLGAQQIAYGLVQLFSGEPRVTLPYWQEEAAVRVHTLLLELCRPVGATIVRISPMQFGVTTTFAGLEQLTDGLRSAPFSAEIRDRLGVTVAVGVGTGQTAASAVTNAGAALEVSLDTQGQSATYVDAHGGVRNLPRPRRPLMGLAGERGQSDRLSQAVATLLAGHDGADGVVVGVDEVASALGVTPRSGQRTLKALVEAGLAWPLASEPSPQGGRPRRRVRLVPINGDGRPAAAAHTGEV